MTFLPFAETDPRLVDALGALSARNRRLASIVEGTSRRRDVRRTRARILLVLLELRCPPCSKPSRPWYVPGAVTRLGIEGLRRAWETMFGDDAPSVRALRGHIGFLERCNVVIRAPGDWIPWTPDPSHPERRPRYPDSFHLVESDEAAEWWARIGKGLLEANRNARYNPDRWRMLFGKWRQRVARELADAGGQGLLPFDGAEVLPPVQTSPEQPDAESLETLAAAVADTRSTPEDVLSAAALAGARLTGTNLLRAAGQPDRLRGAAALFVLAARRGEQFRNRSGWLWVTLDRAHARELAWAVQQVRRTTPPPP